MRYQILRTLFQRQFWPNLKYSSINTYCSEAKPDLKNDPTAWRKPWSKREGEWYSGFNLFAPEQGNSVDVIRLIQSKIDLRPEAIRKWWKRFKYDAAILDMRYIPERHEILGSDLAAAHFMVHRGALVKFKGFSVWIKRVGDDYNLPNVYDPNFVIEAIDIGNMKLFYDGFQNLTNLKYLKWFSFNNSEEIDDWCIDRLSGQFQDTLEYLDLSNCRHVTHRGIAALYRMSKLRTLKVHGISDSEEFQLTCLLLEELLPQLKIEGVKYIELESKTESS